MCGAAAAQLQDASRHACDPPRPRLALALAYVGDNDVSAAALAIGALSLPDTASEAARYAADQGVVLVGAAGDENAWHRNVPAGDSPFLFVKSIRANGRKEDGNATTYMATWNCNNIGPRLDLSAPSDLCATGATARIAGIAGLVKSAGRDHGSELSAGQVRALLRATADDINFSEADREETGVFPAKEGWDAFHGYGRVNVGTAVEAVFDGVQVEQVTLAEPRWFAFSREGAVRVRGEASASWVLEQGAGAEPSSWTEVASGGAGTIDVDVTLSASDAEFADLRRETTVLDRFAAAHQPLVQLRLHHRPMSP